MILQVHDELIFEAPPEEIEILEKIVPEDNGKCHRIKRTIKSRLQLMDQRGLMLR